MSRHPLDFDFDRGPGGDDSGFRLLAIFLALLVSLVAIATLSGCGSTRESAKAVAMADQSLAAAQDQMEREPMPLAMGPDAIVAWAARAYDRVVAARRLLAPVQARLAVGYQPAELATGTSQEMAAKDPQAFDAKVEAQTREVEREADAAGFWNRLGVVALGVLKVSASSGLGLALGGTGAGVLALAGGGKLLGVLRQAKAVADEAIAYGNEVTDEFKRAGGSQARERLALIQRQAVERQAKRGVWQHIDRASKAKRPLVEKEQA